METMEEFFDSLEEKNGKIIKPVFENGKPRGVTGLDGKFYEFRDGEELVINKTADGKVVEVFIRIIDEKGKFQDVLFQDWVNHYYQKEPI